MNTRRRYQVREGGRLSLGTSIKVAQGEDENSLGESGHVYGFPTEDWLEDERRGHCINHQKF